MPGVPPVEKGDIKKQVDKVEEESQGAQVDTCRIARLLNSLVAMAPRLRSIRHIRPRYLPPRVTSNAGFQCWPALIGNLLLSDRFCCILYLERNLSVHCGETQLLETRIISIPIVGIVQ